MANITYNDVLKKDTENLLSTIISQTVGNREFLNKLTYNGNEFGSTLIDVMDAPTTYLLSSLLFSTIYSNVKDYIDNVSNIDLCKTDALLSILSYFSENYSVFTYLNDIPDEIKNLIDIFSINRYHLLDLEHGILSKDVKERFYSQISANQILAANSRLMTTDFIVDYGSTPTLNALKSYCISKTHDISAVGSSTISALDNMSNYNTCYDKMVLGLLADDNQIDHTTPFNVLLNAGLIDTINGRIEQVIPNSVVNNDSTIEYALQTLNEILNTTTLDWKKAAVSSEISLIKDKCILPFIGEYSLVSASSNTTNDINLLELYKKQSNDALLMKLYVNPESEYILQLPGFTVYEQFIAYVLSSGNSISTVLASDALTNIYSLSSNGMMYLGIEVDDKSTLTIESYATWAVKLDALALLVNNGYDLTSNDYLISSDASSFNNFTYVTFNTTPEQYLKNYNNYIDNNKYQEVLTLLFYELLVDSLELTYISGDYIYKTVDIQDDNNQSFDSIKAKYNVPFVFNEKAEVDNIDSGLSSYYDYTDALKKVIDHELTRRAKASDIAIKNSRYAYYREAYVKSYILSVETLYNTTHGNILNLYDIDANYFDLANLTTVKIINDNDGIKTIDYDKVMEVALILTTITVAISSIREKIKTLIERNSIRGTYLIVLLYVIEYIRQVSLQKYGVSNIDLSFKNIKLTEYIDPTEYFNIKNDYTQYTSDERLKVNEQYWTNDSTGALRNDQISSLYNKLLHLSKKDQDSFDSIAFIKAVLESGANSYYNIHNNVAYSTLSGNVITEANIKNWYLSNDASTAVPSYYVDTTLLNNLVTSFVTNTGNRQNANATEMLNVYLRYKYSTNDIELSIYCVKNSIHPSYQIHTNIFDLFEYSELRHSIANYFHKYIPDSYENTLSNIIDSYVGPLGLINNIWKHDAFDFTGYSSRYEIEPNKSDFLTITKYADRDGAFIEDALSAYLTDTGNFISALEAGTNLYYQHLNLSKDLRKSICDKLNHWYDFINTITRSRNDLYEIYDYTVDINNNHLILYKPTLKIKDKIQRDDALGTLWVRLNNHPIAFPAFDILYTDDQTMSIIHRMVTDDNPLSKNALFYSDQKTYVSPLNLRNEFPIGFYHIDLDLTLQYMYAYALFAGAYDSGMKQSRIIFGKLTKTLNKTNNIYEFSYSSATNSVGTIISPNVKKSQFQRVWADYVGLMKKGKVTYFIYIDTYKTNERLKSLYLNDTLANNDQTYTLLIRVVKLDNQTGSTSSKYVEIPGIKYNLDDQSDIMMSTDDNETVTLAFISDSTISAIITNYPEYNDNKLSTFSDITSAFETDVSSCAGITQYPYDPLLDVNVKDTFYSFEKYIVAVDIILLNDNFYQHGDILYYNLNSDMGFIPNYPNEAGKMSLWKSKFLNQLSSWNIQMMGRSTPYQDFGSAPTMTSQQDSLHYANPDNGIRWSQYPAYAEIPTHAPQTSQFTMSVSSLVSDNDAYTLSAGMVSEYPTGTEWSQIKDYIILNGVSYNPATKTVSYTKRGDQIAFILFRKDEVFNDYITLNKLTITANNIYKCQTLITGTTLSDSFCFNVYKIVNDQPYVLYSGIPGINYGKDYYGIQPTPQYIDSGYYVGNLKNTRTNTKQHIDNVLSINTTSQRTFTPQTSSTTIDILMQFCLELPTGLTGSPMICAEILRIANNSYSAYEKYHMLLISSNISSVSSVVLDSLHTPLDYSELSGVNPPIQFKWLAEADVYGLDDAFPILDSSGYDKTALYKRSLSTFNDIYNPTDIFIAECVKFPDRQISTNYYDVSQNEYKPVVLSTELDLITGFYSYLSNDVNNEIQLYFNFPIALTKTSYVSEIRNYCRCNVLPGEVKAIGLFNLMTTRISSDSSTLQVYNNSLVYLGAYKIENMSNDKPKYQISQIDLSTFIDMTLMKYDNQMSKYVDQLINTGIISSDELSTSIDNPQIIIMGVSDGVTYTKRTSIMSMTSKLNRQSLNQVMSIAPAYSVDTISSIIDNTNMISEISSLACKDLTNLIDILLNNVVLVGNSAFTGCNSLTSVELDNCLSIDDYAFSSCSLLMSINMPKCKYIGNNIIKPTTTLQDISFDSLTSLQYGNFNGLTSLTSISFSGCKIIGDGSLSGCSNLIDSGYLISCTTIGSHAFKNCTRLTDVTTLLCTTISSEAFSGCTSLTSVSGSSLKDIGTSAFYNTALKSAKFQQCANVGSYAFSNCSKLENASLAILSCNDGVFKECSALTSVSLLKCTYVGNDAFNGCSSLLTINIPELSAIADASFKGCSTVNINNINKCLNIGVSAFCGCAKLTKIALPACKLIKEYAFAECNNLNIIELYVTRVPTLTNVNAFPDNSYIIFVNDGLYNTIIKTSPWNSISNHIYAKSTIDKGTAIFYNDGSKYVNVSLTL